MIPTFFIMTFMRETFDRMSEGGKKLNKPWRPGKERKIKELSRKREGNDTVVYIRAIAYKLNNTVVESSNVDDFDSALVENSTQHALPTFQVGEIVSVKPPKLHLQSPIYDLLRVLLIIGSMYF